MQRPVDVYISTVDGEFIRGTKPILRVILYNLPTQVFTIIGWMLSLGVVRFLADKGDYNLFDGMYWAARLLLAMHIALLLGRFSIDVNHSRLWKHLVWAALTCVFVLSNVVVGFFVDYVSEQIALLQPEVPEGPARAADPGLRS